MGPSLNPIKKFDFSRDSEPESASSAVPQHLTYNDVVVGDFKPLAFEAICYRATGNAVFLEGRCSAQGLQQELVGPQQLLPGPSRSLTWEQCLWGLPAVTHYIGDD